MYSSLGSDDTKKSVRESFSKSCELDGIIYHANATKGGHLYIVSKQRASLRKDESTRKETAAGEKPFSEEYLVFIELSIGRTEMSTHGHTLGIVTGIGRHWCPCTAVGER